MTPVPTAMVRTGGKAMLTLDLCLFDIIRIFALDVPHLRVVAVRVLWDHLEIVVVILAFAWGHLTRCLFESVPNGAVLQDPPYRRFHSSLRRSLRRSPVRRPRPKLRFGLH